MAAISSTATRIKGNPASHRMNNPRTKAYKAQCWARGEARKKARNAAQMAAAERNRLAGVSPWEIAKAVRRERRAS